MQSIKRNISEIQGRNIEWKKNFRQEIFGNLDVAREVVLLPGKRRKGNFRKLKPEFLIKWKARLNLNFPPQITMKNSSNQIVVSKQSLSAWQYLNCKLYMCLSVVCLRSEHTTQRRMFSSLLLTSLILHLQLLRNKYLATCNKNFSSSR